MDTNSENPAANPIRVPVRAGLSPAAALALSFIFADVVWIVMFTVSYLVGL
jgi:heme/copper-type cytochrome/quinol oxidase subunit 3